MQEALQEINEEPLAHKQYYEDGDQFEVSHHSIPNLDQAVTNFDHFNVAF